MINALDCKLAPLILKSGRTDIIDKLALPLLTLWVIFVIHTTEDVQDLVLVLYGLVMVVCVVALFGLSLATNNVVFKLRIMVLWINLINMTLNMVLVAKFITRIYLIQASLVLCVT